MNFRNAVVGLFLCSVLSSAANSNDQAYANDLVYRVDTCDVLQVIFVTNSKIDSSTDLIAVQRDGSITFPFGKLDVRGRSAEEIQGMLDTLKAEGKIPNKGAPHIKIVDCRDGYWQIDRINARKSK